MVKILRLHIKGEVGDGYIEVLDDVVKETLTEVCREDDFRNMCHKTPQSSVLFVDNDTAVINWSIDGDPVDVGCDSDYEIFMENFKHVPTTASLVSKELSEGENICKHPKLNVWWSQQGSCEYHDHEMDGKYMVLPFPITTSDEIKECKCVVRSDNIYVYHTTLTTVKDILTNGKYVSLLINSQLIDSRESRSWLLDYTVDRWNDLAKSGMYMDSIHSYCDLKLTQALQIRKKLSNQGHPSLLTKEFDGTYIVFYSGSPPNMNNLLPLPKIEMNDLNLDNLRIGWSSSDEWIGFM